LSDPKEIKVKDMARLSILEDKLNDIQVHNLRMFPLIFFNGVTEARIEYDFKHERSVVEYEKDVKKLEIKYKFHKPDTDHSIAYHISLDEKQDNSHLEKRFFAIEKAVRDLLWKNITVSVFFNEKLVYESKDEKKM
jgi:hypothetical protein